MMGTSLHIPVMLTEVMAALSPLEGKLFVDGTFGMGGYAVALLEAAPCRVIGFDRDAQAIARGQDLCARFGERLTLIEGCFGNLATTLAARGIAGANGMGVDGVVFDLGASSPQLDQAARGFSFRLDGPLDMRMSQSQELSAADLVNGLGEAELADIFFHLGEERYARRVARTLVAARKSAAIATTFALADIIRRCVPRSPGGIDPATRCFQALRIAVNDELGELDRGLIAAEQVLNPDGRLAVVAFHSLEDRRVKTFLTSRTGMAPAPSRHVAPPLPGHAHHPAPSFRQTSRRPRTPTQAEIAHNARARSAKLRVAIRTEAPPHSPKNDSSKHSPSQGAAA